jgi:hypothetical protein
MKYIFNSKISLILLILEDLIIFNLYMLKKIIILEINIHI